MNAAEAARAELRHRRILLTRDRIIRDLRAEGVPVPLGASYRKIEDFMVEFARREAERPAIVQPPAAAGTSRRQGRQPASLGSDIANSTV